MEPLTPSQLAWLALLFGLACVALGLWLAGLLRSSDQHARVHHAQEGEREAEHILADAGYTVLQRQIGASWEIWVDGTPVRVSVRADLIVERDGERFVAEVKTGTRAPDPTLPSTRRQLLEYTFVFGVDRVLLVDAQAGVIRTVTFAPAMALDHVSGGARVSRGA